MKDRDIVLGRVYMVRLSDRVAPVQLMRRRMDNVLGNPPTDYSGETTDTRRRVSWITPGRVLRPQEEPTNGNDIDDCRA